MGYNIKEEYKYIQIVLSMWEQESRIKTIDGR